MQREKDVVNLRITKMTIYDTQPPGNGPLNVYMHFVIITAQHLMLCLWALSSQPKRSIIP